MAQPPAPLPLLKNKHGRILDGKSPPARSRQEDKYRILQLEKHVAELEQTRMVCLRLSASLKYPPSQTDAAERQRLVRAWTGDTKGIVLPDEKSSFLRANSLDAQHLIEFLHSLRQLNPEAFCLHHQASCMQPILPEGVPEFALIAETDSHGTTTLRRVPSTDFIAASPVTFSKVERDNITALVNCAWKQQTRSVAFGCFNSGTTSAGARQVGTQYFQQSL
jgi:hypothetical protein